jgi:flagellar hook-length control protein FliK
VKFQEVLGNQTAERFTATPERAPGSDGQASTRLTRKANSPARNGSDERAQDNSAIADPVLAAIGVVLVPENPAGQAAQDDKTPSECGPPDTPGRLFLASKMIPETPDVMTAVGDPIATAPIPDPPLETGHAELRSWAVIIASAELPQGEVGAIPGELADASLQLEDRLQNVLSENRIEKQIDKPRAATVGQVDTEDSEQKEASQDNASADVLTPWLKVLRTDPGRAAVVEIAAHSTPEAAINTNLQTSDQDQAGHGYEQGGVARLLQVSPQSKAVLAPHSADNFYAVRIEAAIRGSSAAQEATPEFQTPPAELPAGCSVIRASADESRLENSKVKAAANTRPGSEVVTTHLAPPAVRTEAQPPPPSWSASAATPASPTEGEARRTEAVKSSSQLPAEPVNPPVEAVLPLASGTSLAASGMHRQHVTGDGETTNSGNPAPGERGEVTAPDLRSSWATDVAEYRSAPPLARIVDGLRHSEMHIRLQTQELGALNIDAVLHENKLGATVRVDHPELSTILNRQVSRLESTLAEHRLELSHFSVMQNGAGSQPQRESSAFAHPGDLAQTAAPAPSLQEPIPAADSATHHGYLNVHA